jgi:hypothetical protein
MKRALQLAQILEHGMASHRQGRLAEAQRLYQAVLNVRRDDFDSQHLLMGNRQRRADSPRGFRVEPN